MQVYKPVKGLNNLRLNSPIFDLFMSSLPKNLLLALIITVVTLGNFLTLPVQAVDYNKVTLIGHDFSGQDLRDASFDLASLRESDFSHADLTGVRFFSANLESVNFEGANLTNATLDSARLNDANLKDAILVGAFVTNVKVPGINIEGADFTDALVLPYEQKLLCKVAKGTNPVTGRDTRETLLCP